MCAHTAGPRVLPKRGPCAGASASVAGHSCSLPRANARAGLRCVRQAHRERRRDAVERFRKRHAGIAARPRERNGVVPRGPMPRWQFILRVTVVPETSECAKGESAYVPEQGEVALVTRDLLSHRNPLHVREHYRPRAWLTGAKGHTA